MSRFFHFTLGPVQSFVAQARRTRDFWAGSFLLSYLSAVAMKAVQKQDGEVLFPAANERFLGWLEGNPGEGSAKPTQGEVPNRFKARVGKGFEPQLIVDSVLAAWSQLGELVWQRDLAEYAAPDSKTREIWVRQVESFWDIVWSTTSDPAASDLIERRKHWRTASSPPEPGTKCMLMDGFQELSGLKAPDADAQNALWEAVRKHRGLDLREEEHLCALAFIKRRFAQHFQSFKATMPGNWILRGWKLPTAVPSVAHLAVAPWLAQVIESADLEAIEAFNRSASRLAEASREKPVTCVKQALETSRRPLGKFAALGADLFFEESLDNPRLYADRHQAMKAKRALLALRGSCSKLGAPSPFYAVLAMDGDNLGKNMQEPEHQAPISEALEQFTERVGPIVTERSGFLVYAGGDDVLALVPLDEALKCAQALRLQYRAAFAGTEIQSTLSGSIVYAHFRVPLTRVLKGAQDLLKTVAKDACKRDAIAVRVVTPGGKTFEWAMPWTIACKPSPYAKKASAEAGQAETEGSETEEVALEEIAEGFRALSGGEIFSSSFFYRIREVFALLNPRSDKHSALKPDEAIALMTAEYLGSGVHNGKPPSLEKATPLVERLLQQCRPVTRTFTEAGEVEDESRWLVSRRLEADGALLARFLARKGVD